MAVLLSTAFAVSTVAHGKWLAGRLLTAVMGDRDIVNCVAAHPHQPLLATCGLDPSVKLFGPHYGGKRSSSQCTVDQSFLFHSLSWTAYYQSLQCVSGSVASGHVSDQDMVSSTSQKQCWLGLHDDLLGRVTLLLCECQRGCAAVC